MKALLLAAALVYQIPLEKLDGKIEQLTVEDELRDGSEVVRCKEVDTRTIVCEMRDPDGNKFWVYIPAQ